MPPLRVALIAFALIASQLTGLHAATYWVSTAGNNANAGTEVQPWRTIQRAVNAAAAGDTILVQQGTYNESVSFEARSGTPGQPITLRAADLDNPPLIDGTGLTIPVYGARALISLYNCSHVVIQGFELANLSTSAIGAVPVGIFIEGSGTGISILDNNVHHIRQTRNSENDADAHGIAVFGTGKTIPLSNITIARNTIAHCLLGSSEALVLNGNVDGFLVENNTVHDCNNIGIDLIGYERTSKGKNVDRARNGVVRGNTVYNIDTFYNPAYGGDPVTGGGDRSAGGIYVDGGTRIVIERNHVFNCNFGIEVASEASNGVSDQITVRNNLLHHNMSAGLIMGGYDSKRGATRFCKITHNTFYQNDTLQTGTGQIALQWKVSDCEFTHNILWAAPGSKEMIIHDPYLPKPNYKKMGLGPNVRFNYNRYHADGGASDAVFVVVANGQRRAYNSLAAWQNDTGGLRADAQSTFGDPVFEVPLPVAAPANPDNDDLEDAADQFKLDSSSPIRDLGQPGFIAASGELDFFGESRIQNTVGIGASER